MRFSSLLALTAIACSEAHVPAADATLERPDAGLAPDAGFVIPVCSPSDLVACMRDADCAPGHRCDSSLDTCYLPGATIGSLCCVDDCDRGSYCAESSLGWPHGVCVGLFSYCDLAADDCPSGSHCVNDEPVGGNWCIGACSADVDCPPGYGCRASSEGRRVCLPACERDASGGSPGCAAPYECNPARGVCVMPFTGRIGADCRNPKAGALACGGGECHFDYCSYRGCNTTDAPCPSGSVCASFDDPTDADLAAQSFCLLRCETDDDCAESGTACLPIPEAGGALACTD